jgi:hydroxymethylbilane synthase
MARERLVIGTRGSQLALTQAEAVASLLRQVYPRLAVELAVIQTKGDRILDRALSRIGDKGLFVSEIEAALVERRVDLAVHSCKDLPSETPDELILAAFPRRADARDALVSPTGARLADLPHGARIGTSSLRRACQLRAYRPDFEVIDLRGNVDTRLRKAHSGDYDAIVLAAAGLQRLNRVDAIVELLGPDVMLPAVAQGALAIECRADDAELRDLLASVDDPATRLAVIAERSFLARLQGGCQVPLAAHATVDRRAGDPMVWAIDLRGLVGTVDGMQVIRGEQTGGGMEAAAIGTALAEQLLKAGADMILERLSRVVPAVEAPEAA